MTKYGIREVVDVTFKAKSALTMGTSNFDKGESVIHFDTAKTGSIEGDAESVYAQGGRGNPRLVTWEGEKTVTFTFEDALISELGMSILLGAELDNSNVEGSAGYFHNVRQRVIAVDGGDLGEIQINLSAEVQALADGGQLNDATAEGAGAIEKEHKLYVYETNDSGTQGAKVAEPVVEEGNIITADGLELGKSYIVDGYVKTSGTSLLITPDQFSDAFYIEAQTLFRRESDGRDVAAQFVIPRGKIQTAFDIEMANSGDPSTFTFTVDAMADYTKQDPTKKVLAGLYINDGQKAIEED